MRTAGQFLLLNLALSLLVFGIALPADADIKEQDILARYGFRAYDGAIPGYIDDRSCSAGGCHADLCKDFAKTDKAHSFLKTRRDRFLADFNQTFHHDLSQRFYQMVQKGDDLFFRRYQEDEKGEPINVLELKVDYLHGSGALARAYIYRTPNGQLFQLPLVWHGTTQRFGMAPGFDIVDHIGITRRVSRECQFCHNGYSELPENGDALGAPPVFPEKMTEGIGCQRCHGPGAEHTRLGLLALEPGSHVDSADLRDSIVNQARLSPRRNDETCNQCHERTAKMIPALNRFGRGVFSYRAGEPLADYMVHIEVSRGGTPMEGRVGAVSQPPRTYQSRCYIESKGQLTCITCHAPHRRIPPSEKAAFYRAACFKCHGPEDCTVPHTTDTATDYQDCVTCHMPKRPSTVQDFPITDHLIERRPKTDVTPTPLREINTYITDARVTEPKGDLGELYRLLGLIRAGAGPGVLGPTSRLIDRMQPRQIDPYLILAQGYLLGHQWENAKRTTDKILELDPENNQAVEWQALSLFMMGRRDEAVTVQRKILEKDTRRTETRFNLSLFLLLQKQYGAAEKELEKALAMNPYLAKAWYYLGLSHEKQKHAEKAVESFRRALEIDPAFGPAYLSLGKALIAQGQREEARRYWRHGIKVADQPEPIQKAYTLTFGPPKNSQ